MRATHRHEPKERTAIAIRALPRAGAAKYKLGKGHHVDVNVLAQWLMVVSALEADVVCAGALRY
jgi:hypothetical protein